VVSCVTPHGLVEQSNFSELLPNSNGLIVEPGLQRRWGDAFTIDRCNVSSPALRRAAQPKVRPMRLLYVLATAMLLTLLIPVLHASAFTIDPASGTNPDGSSRFVDPDEQIHSSYFGGSSVNDEGWADRNSVSRHAVPGTDAPSQGVTFPNWLFPTSPRR
jgi:hypothetical protein